ncbi:MAG: TRAP transporter small permease [Pelistega sp.]|nr:TRAP transporter small permease [Pelistega sp.]
MSDSITTPSDGHKNLKIEDTLLVILMAALACITMANVIVRYFTSQSFAWTEELSIFLLIVVTMLGTSSAFVRHQHISIDFFVNRRTTGTRWRINMLANLIVFSFFLVFTVLSFKMSLDEMEFGDISPSIGVPTWWYSIWLPIISLLICVRLAGLLRRLWKVREL